MMPQPRLPEGLPSAWLLDCRIFAEAIRPDPDLTVCQWADEYRVLSPEISSEPGPWRTGRVPHTREIMEELSPTSPVQEVTLVAGTQVAKTEIGNNFLGFIIDWAPGPAMMVLPTSNTGKRSSKTRLARMIDSTPRLRSKISERSRDGSNSTMMKDFPGGVLVIAGANSAAELKSMPVRYLFEDEVDEYPDDVDGQGPADELAEKRTDTFPRKKIYRASTPTEKGRSKIWKHFERGDQRRYYVPCPHCGHDQVLVWDQVRWETRKVYERVDAETGEIAIVDPGTEGAIERDTGELLDVWYECASCAVRIDEYHKTAMLERGHWIAAAPNSPRASFHLSALYSPLGWFSWHQAVAKRLEADKDPTGFLLKVWTNTVLGEPYAEAGEQIAAHELKQRAGPYALKQVPMGGLLLVASADIQGNRIEVGVDAYGRGEESWTIDYQVIFGDTESDHPWQQLAEYLQSTFRHECGVPLRITATAIDSGFRTQKVYDFVRRYAGNPARVIATKGMSRPGKAILGRPSDQDVTHKGHVIKNGVKMWPIGTDTGKARLFARMKITEPGPGCMHFPLGLADEYWDGLTAERLVTRYHKGFQKQSWEKDAGARNEPLDIKLGCYAAALYAGIQRINWDRLESTLRAAAGDLFVAADNKQSVDAVPEGADATPPTNNSAPVQTSAPDTEPPRRRVRRSNWVTNYR